MADNQISHELDRLTADGNDYDDPNAQLISV